MRSKNKTDTNSQSIRYAAIILIVVSFTCSAFFIAQAWVEPDVDPSGGNIAAPLHTGTTAQIKQGPLTVGGAGGSFGLYAQGPSQGVWGANTSTGSGGILGIDNYGMLGFGDQFGVAGYTTAVDGTSVIGYNFFAAGTGYGVMGWTTGSATAVGGVAGYGIGGYFESYRGPALVTGTGNVGIGTASPTQKLDVNGVINATGLKINGVDVAGGSSSWNAVTGGISYTAGNVGIGTVSPTDKLDVAGNINVADGSAYKYNGVNVITANTHYSNYFFGNAGNLTTDGWGNTATGHWAFAKNTGGFENTAYGMYALYSNSTGSENTANGTYALMMNTRGSANVATGFGALFMNTTGSQNTANGFYALQSNTTGSRNTAFGHTALQDLNIKTNDYSGYNTAVGYSAGRGIVTGVNNTIIGANVAGLPANLSNNIIIADGSGNRRINVDSAGNVGIGEQDYLGARLVVRNADYAMFADGKYYGVFASGDQFGVAGETSAVDGTSVIGYNFYTDGTGYGVMGWTTGSATAVGGVAGNGIGGYFESYRGPALVTGTGNVGIGTASPRYKLDVNGVINATGLKINGVDVAGGSSSWNAVTGGISYTAGNVGIGTASPTAKLDVAGDINIPISSTYKLGGTSVITTNQYEDSYFFGSAGSNLYGTYTTGNTGTGAAVLKSLSNDGAYNTATGYGTLYNTSHGIRNTATGASALQNNTSGSANTAYGSWALFNLNITADHRLGYNTAIGAFTGLGIVTGVNNTIIGANVAGLPANLSNNIIIADGSGNRRINVDSAGNVGIGEQDYMGARLVVRNADYAMFAIGKYYGINSWGDQAGLVGQTTVGTGTGVIGTNFYTEGTGYGVFGWTSGTATAVGGSAGNGIGGYFESYRGPALVTGTGNVGIGTASPRYKLDVNGVINATGLKINGVDVGSSSWNAVTGGISYTAGNVGIGTASPGAKLDVNGYVAAYGIVSNPNTASQPLRLEGRGSVLINADNNNDDSASSINFYINGEGDANMKMTILENSNVGIGTMSPTQKLDVSGKIHANGDVCTDDGGGKCLTTVGRIPCNWTGNQTINTMVLNCNGSYIISITNAPPR